MESVIWSSETRVDLRCPEQSRTYGPSSFLWYFFLLLLKVVSRKVIWLKVHDSWVWRHKSGSHRQFGVLRNGTHPWFQRTLYFMFLEMEGRLEQTTCQNGLGFLWMWKWSLTYVLSISHSMSYHDANNRSSGGQKPPHFIWNFRVCLHKSVPRIIPESVREIVSSYFAENKTRHIEWVNIVTGCHKTSLGEKGTRYRKLKTG